MLNKRIIEAQMKPSTTVFQTQKQFLRDAILEAAGQASSLEEFQKLLFFLPGGALLFPAHIHSRGFGWLHILKSPSHQL